MEKYLFLNGTHKINFTLVTINGQLLWASDFLKVHIQKRFCYSDRIRSNNFYQILSWKFLATHANKYLKPSILAPLKGQYFKSVLCETCQDITLRIVTNSK